MTQLDLLYRETIPPPTAPGGLEVVTATDLFSGGGGVTEGLTQAGIQVVTAANHWQVAVDTHRLNHPSTDNRIANLRDVSWYAYPSTHILWGSPSCTKHAAAARLAALSAAEERRRLAANDPAAVDRATALAVIDAAAVHLYPIVIVENVPEFRKWKLYGWWRSGLEQLGYQLQEVVLDAADYGHAQRRRRLFIVATQPGVHMDLTPPAPVRVPASAILDDDPGEPMTRRLYVSPQVDTITADRVPHLVTYRRNARARRADQHQLATVTAAGNHHAVAQLIDGVPHHRMLTNRECARAQGFPDHYQFLGKPGEVKRMIGNAVAVGVARFLGERARAALVRAAVAL